MSDTTGTPIPDATVKCHKFDGTTADARSGGSGEFSFQTQGSGCRSVAVTANGFSTVTVGVEAGTSIDVSLLPARFDDGSMSRVEGTVVDGRGRGVADASVWLEVVGGERTGGGRTDANGRFSLATGAAGDHVVCARPRGGGGVAACAVVQIETYGDTVKGVRLVTPPRS